MKLKKLICIVMISVLGVLSFAGCAKKQDEKKTETSSEASTQEASAQVFAMDTYMTLTAYGEHAQEAVDKAAERVEALDALLSTGDENSEIYQLIQDLAKQGKAVVMVSSEMPELLGVCNRIVVMSGGRVAGEVDADNTTQEEIMTLAAKYA